MSHVILVTQSLIAGQQSASLAKGDDAAGRNGQLMLPSSAHGESSLKISGGQLYA